MPYPLPTDALSTQRMPYPLATDALPGAAKVLSNPTSDARPFLTNAEEEFKYLAFMTSIEVRNHTVDSAPFIKSQRASRKTLNPKP